MAWLALGLTAETAVFTLAGLMGFRSVGYSLAEAGAAAIVSVFMGLSLIHQLCFFLGSALPGVIIEMAALATIFFFGVRRRHHLNGALASAMQLIRRETLAGLSITGAWMVMAGLVAVGWLSMNDLPAAHPWDGWISDSNRVSWVQRMVADPIPPLNATALFYHTARFGMGPNACGFGLLAHMAVGLSTYALARRYAWPPMALTGTLLVLSMPRLVFLGLWPSAELVSVVSIVFSVVLLYRLVEQHQTRDLRFFLLCILFSIYSNPMSVALVLVMALLLLVVMIRRHGWLMWWELMFKKPIVGALMLLPALGLAQIPVFALNLANGHPLLGASVALDNDGIRGAAANLLRYLLLSVDPTEPVQRMLVWLVGLDLNRLILGIYQALVIPVLGQATIYGDFIATFSGSGHMGFGPFAALLVLPAIIHALLRGPRRLKAVSVAWLGYLYLAALVVAWRPHSFWILSPLYAANGFVVAFSLPPWRLRRRGMRLLQGVFILLLAWSIGCGRWLPNWAP